eukprot:2511871-Lingulodinium_polyedra.AAC.1
MCSPKTRLACGSLTTAASYRLHRPPAAVRAGGPGSSASTRQMTALWSSSLRRVSGCQVLVYVTHCARLHGTAM